MIENQTKMTIRVMVALKGQNQVLLMALMVNIASHVTFTKDTLEGIIRISTESTFIAFDLSRLQNCAVLSISPQKLFISSFKLI
jgi:hypothetical protein